MICGMKKHCACTRGRRALVAAAVVTCIAPCPAAGKEWRGGSGSWGDAYNWTPFGEPTGSDAVAIGSGNAQVNIAGGDAFSLTRAKIGFCS